MLLRSRWAGNRWPSVEIEPFREQDFFLVLYVLVEHLGAGITEMTATLDGYIADLLLHEQQILLHMDNWSLSVAAPSETLREQIFHLLSTHMDGADPDGAERHRFPPSDNEGP